MRKVASGIYEYLPLGFRSIFKVANIIREEMARAGAQEVLMPIMTPAELWQETGRWQKYGKELMRVKDRHERDFALGPTHEEVITDLVRRELKSYKQLAPEPFPDRHQVPRRGPPPVWRDAQPRIPDEGRLFLRRG